MFINPVKINNKKQDIIFRDINENIQAKKNVKIENERLQSMLELFVKIINSILKATLSQNIKNFKNDLNIRRIKFKYDIIEVIRVNYNFVKKYPFGCLIFSFLIIYIFVYIWINYNAPNEIITTVTKSIYLFDFCITSKEVVTDIKKK